MYTGTVIDDLIKAVQRAEAESKQAAMPKAKATGVSGMQVFMHQMQQTQRVRLGVA